MKTTHKEELYIKKDNLTDLLFDNQSIFFDIETTGFSPAHASIYMIGCARKQGNYICIDQFFAENPSEEKVIITAFIELLKQYKTIISFNGIGFDIPFLKAKCDNYGIDESFKNFDYLDIFKIVSSFKFLLKLPNYKQKSIEDFLGISRNDKYNGGELINVYHEYVNNPTDEGFYLLHIHNYEDVLGMIDLLPVLSYFELFQGKYSVLETDIFEYKAYEGETKYEFIITLKNDHPVPKRVSYQCDCFYLIVNQTETKIRIPIFDGELRFFYSNYKDYYYLPKEDMAIHKSVSTYVEKDYREKCRASNCYTRKTGQFLIQYGTIMNPEFREKYKDKHSYFELTEDFRSSDIMLRRYVDHILSYIYHHK